MNKKLMTAIVLVLAFATLELASTGAAAPTPPASPGACNMFNTAGIGMDGMLHDPHFADIMYPFALASFATGCTPANLR